MATYAIGDLQGCFGSLQQLLGEIGYRAAEDRLWFVGDLVNRGPQSLEILRFVRSLGKRAISVLGNHDLHLLMVAEGRVKPHRKDTFEEILTAPDRDELLLWMRSLPLMHVEDGFAMVHAGLLPSWSIAKARALAAEAEQALRGPDWRDLLSQLYGNHPDHWDDMLSGFERYRVIINAMTRLRICTPDGRMEFSYKGPLSGIPAGYRPWFSGPGRKSAKTTIVCGHWSALGVVSQPNLLALDSGCLWGGQLSAVRLEDRRTYQVSCPKLAH
jgi:bis(5'-nucleosyl)-tetraphosphatase (symmetrical)